MMLQRGGAFNSQPYLPVDHSDRYDLSAVRVQGEDNWNAGA
jgi:hypothetical protein